jgi:hypothetical protein
MRNPKSAIENPTWEVKNPSQSNPLQEVAHECRVRTPAVGYGRKSLGILYNRAILYCVGGKSILKQSRHERNQLFSG